MKSLLSKPHVGAWAFHLSCVHFLPRLKNLFLFIFCFCTVSLLSIRDVTAQRLGLHVTQAELNIWKQRANSGPYKNTGDVRPYSPGDWTRIKRNADSFLSNPGADRFVPYTGSGCVPRWSPEPGPKGEKLRDAGFTFLITGDRRYRDIVRNELLAYASNSRLDFSNRSRWCIGVMNDVNPGFFIAEWMNKLLVGYDYIRNSLSSDDRSRLDRWFYDAAYFFQQEVDRPVSAYFVNRAGGNYNLSLYATNSGAANITHISHYGGWRIANLGLLYNNRRGSMARFFGMVGIMQNNSSLKSSAKLFVKEFLKFGVNSQGIVSDFYRWSSSNPEQGWSYGSICVGQVMDIADHFARVGDMELYQYSTSEGMFGSQGGTKNIRLIIKNLLNYMDGTHKRYATTSASSVGNSTYLIDGLHGSWISVNDNWFAQANIYYKDSYIKGVYMRTGSGTRPYPISPSQPGPYLSWTGTGGIYPGKLFMFGQMEGKVWPYSASSAPAPTPAPEPEPTPTPGTGSSTIIVNAFGSSAGGVMAHFNVWVNGQKIGDSFTTTSLKSYSFSSSVSASNISKVVIQFDNDANISGQDRNLFVPSIVAGGTTYSSKGSNVVYDRDAIDGQNTLPGNDVMPWSGGLVFTLNSNARKDVASEDPESATAGISDVLLTPNPNNGVFSLELNSAKAEEEGVYIAVYDIVGKNYYEEQLSSANSKLYKKMDLSSIPKGMYLLKVRIGSEEVVKRFLKQ